MQAADILIHLNANLTQQEKYQIETNLRNIDGVIAPRFSGEHLLLVYYNLGKTSARVLYDFVRASGYKAQLIGL